MDAVEPPEERHFMTNQVLEPDSQIKQGNCNQYFGPKRQRYEIEYTPAKLICEPCTRRHSKQRREECECPNKYRRYDEHSAICCPSFYAGLQSWPTRSPRLKK